MRKFKRFFFGRLFPCSIIVSFSAAVFLFLTLFLPKVLLPALALERAFTAIVALISLRDDELPDERTRWLVLLFFLPWTGAIARLVRGIFPPTPPTRRAVKLHDGILSACAAIASPCKLSPSSFRTAEYFPFGKKVLYRYLNDLNGAEKFIYLEYYIIKRGTFWDSVLKILERKAKSGVEVKLVYDGFGCASTLPRTFRREMKKRGIDARCYKQLPFFPRRDSHRRDHRKCTVIDGLIAYTGGMNLADEYVGETTPFGSWKDDMVRLYGPVAQEFGNMFLERFEKLSHNRQQLPFSTAQEAVFERVCVPFCDEAVGAQKRIAPALWQSLIGKAEKTVYLYTPYLIPDAATARALCTVASSGIDVRILIPHVPDRRSVHLLSRRNARKLSRYGVSVREYADGFLHAKSMTADGQYAVVGSYNLDFRSLYLQSECAVLIKDAPFATEIKKDFLSTWESSVPVPPAKKLERALGAILNFFAPLF